MKLSQQFHFKALAVCFFFSDNNDFIIYLFIYLFLLFICAYNAWVISSPCPHPLPYHPPHPFPLSPTTLIPRRNYFALISNFVEERV
jgi:hypothetical protein